MKVLVTFTPPGTAQVLQVETEVPEFVIDGKWGEKRIEIIKRYAGEAILNSMKWSFEALDSRRVASTCESPKNNPRDKPTKRQAMTYEELVKRKYPTAKRKFSWFWEFDWIVVADGVVLSRAIFKDNAWRSAAFYTGVDECWD